MAAADNSSLATFDRHTYEDPFLDMASVRLPKSWRKMQELCQIFAMTHPQIAPVVWKLAEYPVTSIVYSGNEEAQRQTKDVLEKHVGILDRAIEWGLDYNSGGNCFVTIQFPFLRYYTCKKCKSSYAANEMKERRFDGRDFEARCGSCRDIRKFEPFDQYMQRAKGINVVRLEPMLMTIKYNPITGKHFYYYDIPDATKQAVKRSDWDIIDSTPVGFLNCIIKNTKFKVNRLFHFKRPTLSGREMQWGLPLILPALKDAYLNQIYKKADEMIAQDHTVPLRIMFPEASTQDPLARIALGTFKGFMEQNIKYWRRDKNAILMAPMPVGVKVVGGDHGSYQTIQARQFVVDEIIGAMMVTKGFVMGGEQWSAASVNQRILENTFLNYLRRLDACLQWVAEEIQQFLGLPVCSVAMKPFKKVDDIQQLQLIIQMAREKRVSWNEVLSRFDLDPKTQLKQIEEEAEGYLRVMIQELLGQAEAGAKSAVINAAAQAEAEGAQAMLAQQLEQQNQPKMNEDGTSDQPLVLSQQVDAWAGELLKMDEPEMKATLKRMIQQSPEVAEAVANRATEMRNQQQQGSKDPKVNAGGSAVNVDELLSIGNPDQIASKLSTMEPQKRLAAIGLIQKKNPMLGLAVLKLIAKNNLHLAGMAPPGGGASPANGDPGAGGAGGVDMRPNPEQLPPRRANKTV